MKKALKVAFTGFAWGPWPDPIEYFTGVLSQDYDVVVTESDFPQRPLGRFQTCEPDLIISTIPGVGRPVTETCPHVFFPAEWMSPDFSIPNSWWMTHCYDDNPRHYRLPLYALYGDAHQLVQPKPDFESLWDRKFCCVLFGKHYEYNETPREDFFRKLSEYKRVDSAGHYLNNMGWEVPGQQSGPVKIDFCQQYKFVLAFENRARLGYATEKCFDAMLANSVPIYWGNPAIDRDFNTKSFVNCHDYADLGWAMSHIAYLDTNKEAYRLVIEQPYFANNVVNKFVNRENVLQFFRKVLNDA